MTVRAYSSEAAVLNVLLGWKDECRIGLHSLLKRPL
jgi:hypothetical protein